MVILKAIHFLARLALRSALKYDKKVQKVARKGIKTVAAHQKMAQRLEERAESARYAAVAADIESARKRNQLKEEAARARNLADKLKELV
ncbi:hypothetical protein [Aeromonas phage PZL-Ah152]|uniref:Uncharacterized protein n=2 Tax=Armandvirus TaxID=3424952 RepID=A0AAE9BMZ8_9CAUD|nr:hypothetical protein [Aeromonas phage PZL-Ah152]UAT28101.1 hypothetical protein [Aeromonas phage PZL-Ah8]